MQTYLDRLSIRTCFSLDVNHHSGAGSGISPSHPNSRYLHRLRCLLPKRSPVFVSSRKHPPHRVSISNLITAQYYASVTVSRNHQGVWRNCNRDPIRSPSLYVQPAIRRYPSRSSLGPGPLVKGRALLIISPPQESETTPPIQPIS